MDKRKFLSLPLDQRQRLWAKADRELEEYCHEPIQIRERPVIVEVPDPWKVALAYSSESAPRRTRRAGRKKEAKPKTKEPPPAQRLSPEDIADLKFYWEDFPLHCGLRCAWYESVEARDECAKCGAGFPAKSNRKRCPNSECRYLRETYNKNALQRVKSGAGSAWHPTSNKSQYDVEMVGLVSSGIVERSRRARDALVGMVDRGWSRDVAVIYAVYGDNRNPFAPFGVFGDLAHVVSMTNLAVQLGKTFGLPERDAIERRLQMPGGDLVKERLKQSAEKMLCEASERYRACK